MSESVIVLLIGGLVVVQLLRSVYSFSRNRRSSSTAIFGGDGDGSGDGGFGGGDGGGGE